MQRVLEATTFISKGDQKEYWRCRLECGCSVMIAASGPHKAQAPARVRCNVKAHKAAAPLKGGLEI